MEFFACFHEFYNMGKKNRGVKKSHQTKNLKFANGCGYNFSKMYPQNPVDGTRGFKKLTKDLKPVKPI